LSRWPKKVRGHHVPNFPDLKKMQVSVGEQKPRQRQQQTPEQMLAIAKMITAAMGGTIDERLN